jgi:hypothetical protein
MADKRSLLMQEHAALLRERERQMAQEKIKGKKTMRETLEKSKFEAEAAEKKLKDAIEEAMRLLNQVAKLESCKRPVLNQRQLGKELQVRSSMCLVSQLCSVHPVNLMTPCQ